MGTLGCINDMMRRDKENRELRKAGKERLNETRNRLIDLNKKGHSSHLSLEQLEEIRIKTQEKEEAETHQLFIMSIYNQLLLNNLQVISQKYGRNL